MQADKVDMYLMTNGKSFPGEQTALLREKLLALDDSQFMAVQSTELKNPTTMLIISLFVGALGVDRFMLGQVGMGILKLLTGGVCGILALIDWITIQKKTRAWNFDKIMLTLQTAAPGVASAVTTEGEVPNSNAPGVTTSGTPPTAQPSQASKMAKEGMDTFIKAGEGAFGFLKVFIKNPIGAMRGASLGFNESLIFAGAQALGLALTLLVLTFRGGNLPIIGSVFAAYGRTMGAPSRIGLFFQAILFCAVLLIILTAVTLFFGKVVFKGNFGGSGDFKKLFGYVLTAEIPLTFALVVSVVVALIAPPLAFALIAAGVIAAIVLESAVFSSVFGLSEDQSAYATISTFSIQILVILMVALLAG